MINVKSTLFNTLKTAFDKMRLLGDNNTTLLKKVLFLAVLDDIYDWSDYLDEKQSVQKRLQELRTNFIMCNPEFDICRFPFDQHYVNVNTPQTNYTWKRVWDAPEEELTIITSEIEESINPIQECWIPDPNCVTTIVYFGENEEIKADPVTGKPLVILSNLTTCDKMNIYINRETGTLWYLNECGIWKQVEDGSTQWTEDDILEVASKLKIHHYQNEDEPDINAMLSKTENDPIEFCDTEQLVEDLV